MRNSKFFLDITIGKVGNKKRLIWFIGIFMVALFLAGCSNRLAKIPIQDAGRYQVEFDHPGGKLEFWTDFDVEFQDSASFIYQIAVYQNDALVGEIVCNPMAVTEKRMERFFENQGVIKTSFLGLMTCTSELPQGDTTIVVVFEAVGKDTTIFRADLVIHYQTIGL